MRPDTVGMLESPAAATSYLGELLSKAEPQAPLEAVVPLAVFNDSLVCQPRYRGDRVVYGGAQYVVGSDGSVLAAATAFTPDEARQSWLAGERSLLPDPPGSPQGLFAARVRNCAACARTTAGAFAGAAGVPAECYPQIVDGQWCDGELAAPTAAWLGRPFAPMLPGDVMLRLEGAGLGAHAVVAIVWPDPDSGQLSNRGHLFNALVVPTSPTLNHVEFVDSCLGKSGVWPPPYIDRAAACAASILIP